MENHEYDYGSFRKGLRVKPARYEVPSIQGLLVQSTQRFPP